MAFTVALVLRNWRSTPLKAPPAVARMVTRSPPEVEAISVYLDSTCDTPNFMLWVPRNQLRSARNWVVATLSRVGL